MLSAPLKVIGKLLDVGTANRLQSLTGLVMELRPLRGKEVAVDGLARQSVDKRVFTG
jgi:hypothetical protein